MFTVRCADSPWSHAQREGDAQTPLGLGGSHALFWICEDFKGECVSGVLQWLAAEYSSLPTCGWSWYWAGGMDAQGRGALGWYVVASLLGV